MYDIGIDVGGTGITAGLVDDGCRIAATKSIEIGRASCRERVYLTV